MAQEDPPYRMVKCAGYVFSLRGSEQGVNASVNFDVSVDEG
jgi:hypothetical protein